MSNGLSSFHEITISTKLLVNWFSARTCRFTISRGEAALDTTAMCRLSQDNVTGIAANELIAIEGLFYWA